MKYTAKNIGKAISRLVPGARFDVVGNSLEGIHWLDSNKIRPSDSDIMAEMQKAEDALPMKRLREERDKKLAETDWWTLRASDGVAMTQEQKDYRQALRDLPSTASPQLDENGQLSNVTWPTKPE